MNADVFHATIAYYKKLRHTNNEKLRAHTTLARSTFYYYMRDPADMPLGVFEQIMDSLNVPTVDRYKCFNN